MYTYNSPTFALRYALQNREHSLADPGQAWQQL